ncbi:MAG: acyl-CoA reductase [Tunicatimonas sp.]
MIQREDRINAFAAVGKILHNLRDSERAEVQRRARAENSWFTEQSVDQALAGVQRYLDPNKLRKWTHHLPDVPASVKKVGVVMAGNIPLVGFHDFLTVLISGHTLWGKLSSQDAYLLRYLTQLLIEIEPRFAEHILWVDRLKDADAIIATGSDNTARYFEYYFAKYPHIIRKNRTGVGVLRGNESKEGLHRLGQDVFQYFGLGCRNVSRLWVPTNYDFVPLIEAWEPHQDVLLHHKYHNNYDYNKSIHLVNGDPFLETGFALLKENEALVSPISMVFYETYADQAELKQKLTMHEEKIQCIVSEVGWWTGSIPFGQAQQPELGDYADGVNTLAFVNGL